MTSITIFTFDFIFIYWYNFFFINLISQSPHVIDVPAELLEFDKAEQAKNEAQAVNSQAATADASENQQTQSAPAVDKAYLVDYLHA